MKINRVLIIVFLICQSQLVQSQKNNSIKWIDPLQNENHVVEGQAWPSELKSTYNRLPKRAKDSVRKVLWDLSENSAGLSINFKTNSSNIYIRYKVKGNYGMPHMPATGVSGVDLYVKDHAKWLWCRGNFSFGDTIQYSYRNIKKMKIEEGENDYKLYLPLYNTLEWLEIGIDENMELQFSPISNIKPIVIYGTSITQGACASRSGMAWTSILQRKISKPIINLGFSGNGRLENEIINLLAEIEAQLYVLDCLPNLSPSKELTLVEIKKRILISVQELRTKRPKTPILLVDHSGYADGLVNIDRSQKYKALNKINKEVYKELKSLGFKKLYLLSKKEIGLSNDSYVDGTHPSDLGMFYYAKAYEKQIRRILK